MTHPFICHSYDDTSLYMYVTVMIVCRDYTSCRTA